MVSKEQVYSQIEASGKLPTLPEVLLKLLSVCNDPESSISDIAAIIEQDPSLSLRVLQLVNSAYYGLRHNFSGIEQAVVYLGANTIKNLVITSSVHQVFANKQNGGASFATGAFWYHSLLTATIAKRISLESGLGNTDEAYLAGLLHDIGKPFLVSAFSDTYTDSGQGVVSDVARLATESEQTGINHCEAGSWLVRQWNLGSLVADAVEYHHETLERVSEAFPLVKIVYLANVLAKSAGDNQFEEINTSLFGEAYFCDCKSIVASGAEDVEQIAASMGIHAPPPQPSTSEGGSSPETEQEKTDSSLKKTQDHAETVNALMAAKVRNISLLSTFQEDLLRVEGVEGVLSAFEKAMNIQLGLGKVMFFLPENDDMLLRCRTSVTNTLHEICGGLSFPVTQSSSRIVSAFTTLKPGGYITREQPLESIADQQILTLFRCTTAYPIPLVADNRGVGVILLGLPDERTQLAEEERQLLEIISQQVALRLHLEQEKIRTTEAVNKARAEAISTAARKLAHEINNPLGIISNYLVAMRMKLTGDSVVLEDLGIIDEEIQRISQMVSQMELFSQAPSYQFTPIDVNVVVRDIIQIVKPSLFSPSDMSVSFIPGADIAPVTSSKDGLKQVVINLIKNAAEALEESGRVAVRTRKAYLSDEDGQEGVEIIVADSGPGLPSHVKENLYKPFVTTKQNGHSGLGLSIVQRIVTDLGGKLSCTSSPEEGTTFTIFLPYIPADTHNDLRG